MSITIDGLDIVLSELESLANDEKTKEALNKATLIVERSAKQKAPKEIAQTITSKIDDTTGVVYTPVYWAPYVEYGTGLFSDHPMGGRKEVPWVYVEGSGSEVGRKTIHTEQSAKRAVAYLRSKGLPAYSTSGQQPQPYMRPALNENKEKILRLFGEVLTND